MLPLHCAHWLMSYRRIRKVLLYFDRNLLQKFVSHNLNIVFQILYLHRWRYKHDSDRIWIKSIRVFDLSLLIRKRFSVVPEITKRGAGYWNYFTSVIFYSFQMIRCRIRLVDTDRIRDFVIARRIRHRITPYHTVLRSVEYGDRFQAENYRIWTVYGRLHAVLYHLGYNSNIFQHNKIIDNYSTVYRY